MKRNGNTASNRMYNPQNKKPQIPLDVDEVDAALERFIRQKYDQQLFSSNAPREAVRHDTGSTRSSDDQPPPLPPKPGKRFGWGLRSVSSALPLSRSGRTTPPTSPDESVGYGAPPSPIRVNKQSRVFGASVGASNGEDMDAKLATLRDMGFPDEKRNASILKGVGGNLERAIEALVRLGEASNPSSRSRTPAQTRNVAVSQPLPSPAFLEPIGLSNITQAVPSPDAVVAPKSNGALSNISSTVAQAPNDRSFSPAPSQASNSSFHTSNPFQPRPYNPFESTDGSQSANLPIDRAFGNMAISQPLFPNATGGYPQPQQHTIDPRIQHSMTPPVPQVPQQYYQPNQQMLQPQLSYDNSNPFIQASQQNFRSFSSPYATAVSNDNQTSYNVSNNVQQPVMHSPIREFPQQLPQPVYQQHQPHQQFLHETSQIQPSPYMSQPAHANQAAFNNQQNVFQNQTLPPPLQAQQTGRFDKSSIMALYNYPQLAPSPLSNINEDSTTQQSTVGSQQTTHSSTGMALKQTQRSVTMPAQMMSGSRNPFQSAAPAKSGSNMGPPGSTNGQGMSRHVSQESVDIGGYQSGRHSPDAFASLSARYVR